MNENCVLPEAEGATRPLSCQESPRHRILVVDDDFPMRQFNTVVLLHAGYEVDSAEDGAIAWAALQGRFYDLLVTDNNMPNLTGVQLLRKVRESGMILPVLMATGIYPGEEFTRQPWLKPAAVLLKPYPMAELVGTVKRVLREADSTGEGVPLFKHRDMQVNGWDAETATSAADRCVLPQVCAAEFESAENDLATGRGPDSSGATSPSFEVAR